MAQKRSQLAEAIMCKTRTNYIKIYSVIKRVSNGATIEIRLYRKGTYILADIHGMDNFCTKLAPPPYNKPRSCVSKIHTPMVMVWFGNV
jgi:hypothetical protein